MIALDDVLDAGIAFANAGTYMFKTEDSEDINKGVTLLERAVTVFQDSGKLDKAAKVRSLLHPSRKLASVPCANDDILYPFQILFSTKSLLPRNLKLVLMSKMHRNLPSSTMSERMIYFQQTKHTSFMLSDVSRKLRPFCQRVVSMWSHSRVGRRSSLFVRRIRGWGLEC